MASKYKDMKQDQPQEEPQVLFSLGAVGQGHIGAGAIGEAGEVKATSSGVIRSVGTGAYEVDTYFYRASIYSELAKTNRPHNTKKMLQLYLGQTVQYKKVEEYLPVFNNNEWLAFMAIQKFVDIATKKASFTGEISFTLPEFYDACGLSKASNHQKEEALEALRGFMTRPKKIIYKFTDQKRGRGGRKDSDVHILTTPLLVVIEMDSIEANSEEEADQIIGRELAEDHPSHGSSNKRLKKITVRPVELFYKQLDTFHVKKAISQYDEIKALHPGKAHSHSLLLTDALQTLNFSPYKPNKEELAYVLGLKGYIQQRKTSVINRKIAEALQDAKTTGYLLDYYQDPMGVYVLHLNPERCLLYAEKLARAKKEEA